MSSQKSVAVVVLVCVSAVALYAKQGARTDSDARDLYSRSENTRSAAAARLVAAGTVAIPFLKSVLCDRTRPDFERAWPYAARALGELKAQDAASCLVELLMWQYPPGLGAVVLKSDDTLLDADPAFAALVQIGEPAVPTIRRHLPFLGPDQALMAVRILRLIDTQSAREAAGAYVKVLEDQIVWVKSIMEASH
jgi:hypothetical protein